MPDLPPDPRELLDQRIRDLKKQSQKLNAEAILALADLERAKANVKQTRGHQR